LEKTDVIQPRDINILIGCETSGVIREAFRERGFNAISCDLLASEKPGPHLRGDVLEAITFPWDWHCAIFHPDCTYLSSSGLHWNKRTPGRAEKTTKALEFVRRLWNADIPHIALENPVGCINTRMPEMPVPQWIQPHEFGHDASKKTGLWLKNLPPLTRNPADFVAPRIVQDGPYKGKKRWANQTDSGQNRHGPSADRWLLRARTYEGWAQAMAKQWGDYLLYRYDLLEV
jgi:hypothetical protein